MSDVYGYKRSPRAKSVFHPDTTTLNVSSMGGDAAGLMVQQWQVEYQQEIRELFELGSSHMYWVRGRPSGTASFNRIIGPAGWVWPNDLMDACTGGVTMTIAAKGPDSCGGEDAGSAEAVNVTLEGCVAQSVGFSMSVEDMMLREAVQIRFLVMGGL